MPGFRSALLPLLFATCALVGCDESPQVPQKSENPKPVVPGAVDADAPEEFTTTESGLKYRIRRKTDGKKPTEEQAVTVHFRGWLDDGTIFDTTYGTGGAPRPIEVKNQTAGWSEGLQLVGEGGMIELELPGKLAFGEMGLPPLIPPNATVHVLIEVLKVFDPQSMSPPPDHEHDHLPKPEDSTSGLQPGPVDSDAPEDFTTTASGLKYRIRRKSNGAKPNANSKVMVHYRGWLDDGKTFDSSYARGIPAEFPLTGVIKAWTEGLQLVGVGGMIEIEAPYNLAYGEAGRPPQIPPKATLHFIIELKEVK